METKGNPGKILVAGEAVVDLIEQRQADGSSVFKWVLGGSPLNVAVGLARLGCPVAYLNAISTDSFGERFAAFILSEGIDRRFIVRTDRPSSLAFATLDPSGVPEYLFRLENAADRSLGEVDLPDDLPDDIACFHFGSLAAVLEPSATTLNRFVARMARQRTISFDPNVRPTVTSDRESCRARYDALFAHVDLVKASAEDIRWLYGTDDIGAVARDWSLRGPHAAIITAGGDGAVAAIDGQLISVPSVAVDVVDTIGAGDTFQSVILARLAEDNLLAKDRVRSLTLSTLQPILTTAAAAAALTCSRHGADLPRRDEVESFLARKPAPRAC
jgi:fructokinase